MYKNSNLIMKRIFSIWLFVAFPYLLMAAEVRLKPYEEYIKKYAPLAMEQQIKYGIPSSITLAQGLLESNAGNSTLAQNTNNHFGIKCHRGWTGRTYSHFDDGKMSCFRKYDKVSESYQDHSLFIVTGSRYDALFELNVKNYKGWAKGLKAAGYATDKQYAKKLINIIQLYDLHEYDVYACNHPRKVKKMAKDWSDEDELMYAKLDNNTKSSKKAKTAATPKNKSEKKAANKQVKKENQRRESLARTAKDYNYLSEMSKEKQPSRNQYNERTDNLPQTINAVQKHTILYKGSVPYIIAQYGDSYSNLADEFGLSPQRLSKINEYPSNYRFRIGDIVFLSKKMDIWEGENEFHVVRSGESMHDIAQLYGLKVMALYELNGMKISDSISVGQKLKLR